MSTASPPSHAQAQAEVLDAFVELLDQVEHEGEHPAFYGRLGEAVCRVSDMDRALVIRYDPGRRRVRVVGGFNIDPGPYLDVPLSLESADIAREALLEDRVLEAHPPFAGRLPDKFLSIADAGPLVVVPMCAGGLPVGVVIAQRAGGSEPLSEDTRHGLWTLGKTAALAATARIATHQQAKARSLQERIDLGRDIHDRVVQRLFGVLLTLSASDRDLAGAERERCAGEVQVALHELRAALERPLGHQPRPTTTTLAEELARLQADAPGFAVHVHGDPAATPAALESLTQAVLAEAVVNAAKHATPSRMDVSIERPEGAFVLEISNDGLGDDPRHAHVGMGLRMTAHAALQAGGLLEHGRRPDGRWQVRLVVGQGPA